MQYIQLQPQPASSIPTPPLGSEVFFIDSNDSFLKIKNEFDEVTYASNYVSGGTYSDGTITIINADGTAINISGLFTGSTTAIYNSLTANTITVTQIGSSGDCVDDIYVSNIQSCSPLNINSNDEGNVYFGSLSGVTISLTETASISIGTNDVDAKLNLSNEPKKYTELLTNGTFEFNADGWTLDDCITWSPFQLNFLWDGPCGSGIASTTFNTEKGKLYELTFEISNATGNTSVYFFNEVTDGLFSNGTHKLTFISKQTVLETVSFEALGLGDDFTLSNVSVKEGFGSDYLIKALAIDGTNLVQIGDVDNNIMIGMDSGFTGASNSNFMGYRAGKSATNSSCSSFMGYEAGAFAFDSDSSNFMGYKAGKNARNSRCSNFIGFEAGCSATGSSGSNFFGQGAGVRACGSFGSIFIGPNAGCDACNSLQTSFVGPAAGKGSSDSYFSNIFGFLAGDQGPNIQFSNVIGGCAAAQGGNAYFSNIIGYWAGYCSKFNNWANFIGWQAGFSATCATSSTFIGWNAGICSVSAFSSNFIGESAGNCSSRLTSSNFIGRCGGALVLSANNSNFIGTAAGFAACNSCNSNFIGVNTGRDNCFSTNSNFIGNAAGRCAKSASTSNFFGINAGNSACNTCNSNFIGGQAGRCACDSCLSNFIGELAGCRAISACSSNFIGSLAGNDACGVNQSNFIGQSAGQFACNTFISTFIGQSAGSNACNSNHAQFIGVGAGSLACDVSCSNFVGLSAGLGACSLSGANFMGYFAGSNAKRSSWSNFIGHFAGDSACDSCFSNFMGYCAGKRTVFSEFGCNNIIIGTNVSLPTGANDSINIGSVLFGTGTYSTTTGLPRILPTTNGRIGIGTNAPSNTLHVSASTNPVRFDGLQSGDTDTRVITTSTDGVLRYRNITDFGGAITFEEKTYTELYDMYTGGTLVAGSYYRITDFQTCYDQPDYDYNGTPIVGDNYKVADIDPIIVFATSNTTLSENAYQPSYPKDSIKYDVTFNLTEKTGSPAKGRITERIDEFNNRTDYDHRTVLFKRYRYYELQLDNPYQGTVAVADISSTEMTVFGTGTNFFGIGVGVKVGFESNNNDYRVYEIIDIVSNTEMTISGLTTVTLGPNSKMYFADWDEYASYYQNNVDGSSLFEEYYTFQGDDNFNNYIGNHANLYGNPFENNDFLLANNVFHDRFVGNKFGDNSYNNTFFDDCYDNNIGNRFYNNITDDDFDSNIIGNEFHDNRITANFQNNRIGEEFRYNYIVQYDFRRNNIMNRFEYNEISNGDFENNEIANEFNNNKIKNSFYENKIGFRFQLNTITNNFYKNDIGTYFNSNEISGATYTNKIGESFENNTIYENFFDNQIFNEFKGNITYQGFYANKTDWGVSANEFSGTSGGNSFGSFFTNNDFLGDVYANVIKDGFVGNTIGNGFNSNNIGSNFNNNTIAQNFQLNEIGSFFQNNTIDEGFGFGGSNSQKNYIGDNFQNNNIGEYFYNNRVGNYFQFNTVGDYFQWNVIDTDIISTSFIANYGNITGFTYVATGTTVLPDGSYINLLTTTNANGIDATFDVSVSSGVIVDVQINSSGRLYGVSDTLTILGTDINGYSDAIDTFSSDGVGKNGLDGTYNNLSATGGTGINATFDVNVNSGLVDGVVINNRGGGYQVSDTLTIIGSLFGGTDGVDDITITVTALFNDDVIITVTGISPTPSVYEPYTCHIFEKQGGNKRLSYYDANDILTVSDINE